jgi:hypothetical protein
MMEVLRMAVSKSYDEMTDITKYSTAVVRVGSSSMLGKFAKQLTQVHISLQVVIGISEGELFSYIVFRRRGYDWSWISNADTIFLVDGSRTQGTGEVIDSHTSSSDTTVYCNETVIQDTDIDYLWAISKAGSVKFRVGAIDVAPPAEFFTELKEILETTKGLGK